MNLNVSNPASTAWGTANLGIFVPFWCPTVFKFTVFTWRNGATISGNLDVGVYSWDGTKIITLGSTAQAAGANAIQTGTVASTTLSINKYWLGMSLSSTTGTIYCDPAVNVGLACALGVFNQASVLPLPSTLTLVNPTSVNIPDITIS